MAQRKCTISELEDGSIVIEGEASLIQKAIESERRTEPKKGIFSDDGKLRFGVKVEMPRIGLDIGKSMPKEKDSFFGNAPNIGKINKPNKGFGDIVKRGSTLPEMPEPKMPEGFGLDLRKKKKSD